MIKRPVVGGAKPNVSVSKRMGPAVAPTPKDAPPKKGATAPAAVGSRTVARKPPLKFNKGGLVKKGKAAKGKK